MKRCMAAKQETPECSVVDEMSLVRFELAFHPGCGGLTPLLGPEPQSFLTFAGGCFCPQIQLTLTEVKRKGWFQNVISSFVCYRN